MAVRSKYQPFSFQERITPLLMLKEEHDKIDEGIALLGEAANQYYEYLDPETRKEVDAYNAQLSQVAGSLASEGMKAVSRNTLNNLRREYNGRIKHIQEAAQTVGNMQAQIREMAMKDPTLMVQSIPSVSDVLNDPTARPSIVSGSILQKEGIDAAQQIQGVDYDTIRRYLNGDLTAIPGIQQSIDKIASDYGVTTDQARSYISRGIVAGLGQRAAKLEAAQQSAAMEYDYKVKLLNAQAGKDAYLAKVRHGYTMEEIAARNAGKRASGSGRGGASYINQINGVVYAKGNDERMFNNVKDADAAMSSTKAKYKGFMDLNRENKIRVLRALGADITVDSSDDLIDEAIMNYENELYNYTYMEYRDKEGKSSKRDEFFMIPNKVRRDTYDGGDDEYDDFYLSQGE